MDRSASDQHGKDWEFGEDYQELSFTHIRFKIPFRYPKGSV